MASTSPTFAAVQALSDQLLSSPLSVLQNPSAGEIIGLVNRLIALVGLYRAQPLTGPEKTEVVLGVLRRVRDYDLAHQSQQTVELHRTAWEAGLLTTEALIPVLVAAYKASPAVIGAAVTGGGCWCC